MILKIIYILNINMSNLHYDWDQGAWKILKLLMNEPKYLVQHQINSFNYFLDNNLRNVILHSLIHLIHKLIPENKIRMLILKT